MFVWLKSSTEILCSLHRNIATIAVFYALPVVQLVITYQTVSDIYKRHTFLPLVLWVMIKLCICSAGGQCHREPGYLLLQLPVRPPPGSTQVLCVGHMSNKSINLWHCPSLINPFPLTVLSTTSSVILVTWCWDSYFYSLSSGETLSTTELWSATNLMLW